MNTFKKLTFVGMLLFVVLFIVSAVTEQGTATAQDGGETAVSSDVDTIASFDTSNPYFQDLYCNIPSDKDKMTMGCHLAFLRDFQPAFDLAPLGASPCIGGVSGGIYPCDNIDMLSFLPLAQIGGGNGNDIWGWTDPQTNKEYALFGRTNGTAFIDVSNPMAPVYLGNLPSHTGSSSWRDIKVYNNHAYIVADFNSNHGMQIFDLTRLRNVVSPPVVFTEDGHYNNFGSSHNIAINEDSGFAYALGISSFGTSCSGGLHMINLQNPTNPTFAGCYSGDGYTHDAQCVNYNGPDAAHQGKEICFNSNTDTLTIVNVTNKAAPVMLSRTGYPTFGYTHQGWLTEDHKYFILDDEGDEGPQNTRTYLWDVQDLDNPFIIDIYTASTAAIDHNLYIDDGLIYQANYRAGLRILDAADIANGNLTEVGFFDIYPSNDNASFNGAWSNYPYFESGIIIVSGIEQGLFVLQQSGGGTTPTPTPSPTITPTPTNTPQPGGTMHVGDLDGSSAPNGSRWNASVVVTIHDAAENPVVNATVSGLWSNGTNGSGNCVTNGNGQCTITKNNLRGTVSSVTFAVTNVTHTSNTYQSGSNHDSDGDSDGTTIVVFKNGQPGPTPTPTPTVTPGPGVVIHVGDLDGSGTTPQNNIWEASVTVTVHNGSEGPVAGAAVSGSWNAGPGGTSSCTTDSSGQCTITKNLRGNVLNVTFTVNNVSLAGATYNAGANHDPDGDSSGTVITVSQP